MFMERSHPSPLLTAALVSGAIVPENASAEGGGGLDRQAELGGDAGLFAEEPRVEVDAEHMAGVAQAVVQDIEVRLCQVSGVGHPDDAFDRLVDELELQVGVAELSFEARRLHAGAVGPGGGECLVDEAGHGRQLLAHAVLQLGVELRYALKATPTRFDQGGETLQEVGQALHHDWLSPVLVVKGAGFAGLPAWLPIIITLILKKVNSLRYELQ